MARTERTSHDTTLDKNQNVCRVRGCLRPRNSSPSAADMGTPELRTLHRDVLSRTLRSAAESLATTADGIDGGKPAVHPLGSHRTQLGGGASDHRRVDASPMPLVGEQSTEADQDY